MKADAGTDVLTSKRHYLTDTIESRSDATAKETKDAWKVAERIRRDFITQVDERRHPRTKGTGNQMLDRYFDPAAAAVATSPSATPPPWPPPAATSRGDSSFELPMADALANAGRRFTKPLRYDHHDAVVGDVILTPM